MAFCLFSAVKPSQYKYGAAMAEPQQQQEEQEELYDEGEGGMDEGGGFEEIPVGAAEGGDNQQPVRMALLVCGWLAVCCLCVWMAVPCCACRSQGSLCACMRARLRAPECTHTTSSLAISNCRQAGRQAFRQACVCARAHARA